MSACGVRCLEGSAIYSGTVTSHSCLYIPSGWVLFVRGQETSASGALSGLTIQAMVKEDSTAKSTLTALLGWVRKSKSQDAVRIKQVEELIASL